MDAVPKDADNESEISEEPVYDSDADPPYKATWEYNTNAREKYGVPVIGV